MANLANRLKKEKAAATRIKKIPPKSIPGCAPPGGKNGWPTRVNAEEKALIAKCHIEGMPNKEIAKGLGRGIQSVAKVLKQDDIKAFIETETRKLMEDGLVPARETMVRLAKEGKEGVEVPMLKLSLEAAKTILGAAGITASGSTTINTILNVTQNPEIGRELSELSAFLAKQMKDSLPEVIDV